MQSHFATQPVRRSRLLLVAAAAASIFAQYGPAAAQPADPVDVPLPDPAPPVAAAPPSGAAVANFTKSLAAQGLRDDVNVNAVHPGLTMTDRFHQLMESRSAAAPGRSTSAGTLTSWTRALPASRVLVEAIDMIGRSSGKLAIPEQWRRGVYMHWQRTFLLPSLVNFEMRATVSGLAFGFCPLCPSATPGLIPGDDRYGSPSGTGDLDEEVFVGRVTSTGRPRTFASVRR